MSTEPLKAAKSALLWIACMLLTTLIWLAYAIIHVPFAKVFGKRRHQQDIDTASRLVVITGTDTGMGRLLAELLGDQSIVHVLALTLTDKAANDLNEKYKASTKFVAQQCDVTKDKDVQRIKQYVARKLENDSNLFLHSIINNAGVADPCFFVWDGYMETCERTFNVNFHGTLRITHALLPTMVKQNKRGKIINVTSVNGVVPFAGNSAYSASKFALEGWSNTLRLELVDFGIDVVTVRPGCFKTDIHNMFKERSGQNFYAASDDIKHIYGGESFLSKWHNLMNMGTAFGQPPKIVADLIQDILVTKDPKPSYWVGIDAAIVFRALCVVPQAVTDFFLTSAVDLRPLNAGKHVPTTPNKKKAN